MTEGLITKEDILLPGTDVNDLGRLDLTTPEMQELIRETNEKALAILDMHYGRYPYGV